MLALRRALTGARTRILAAFVVLLRSRRCDYDPGSNVIDVYVGYLRKKVGSRRIETARGSGYRFEA